MQHLPIISSKEITSYTNKNRQMVKKPFKDISTSKTDFEKREQKCFIANEHKIFY